MTEPNGTTRALAPLSPAAAPLARALEMDQARLALLTRTIGADLKPDELQLFLAVAARTRLDPFLRQIYPIKDGRGRFFIHVGIDGRRVIAQRTGLVDGTLGPYWCGPDGVWKDVWLDETLPVAARFGVLKKGCREPFFAVAHMKGFRQQTGRWVTDSPHQLAKVAEDHAWRKAFPYEMGAVPTYRPEHDEEDGDELPRPGVRVRSDSDGTARGGWPTFDTSDDPEGEYREIDHATGEITETTRAPAGSDRSGSPQAAVAHRAAEGGRSQPAPEPEDLDAAFEELGPSPAEDGGRLLDAPAGRTDRIWLEYQRALKLARAVGIDAPTVAESTEDEILADLVSSLLRQAQAHQSKGQRK